MDPITVKVLPLSKQKISCPEECSASMIPSNLVQHLKSCHGYDDNQILEFKMKLKAKKAEINNTVLHTCDECGHTCASKSGLLDHLRVKHRDRPVTEYHQEAQIFEPVSVATSYEVEIENSEQVSSENGRLLCPEISCEESFNTRENLAFHFNTYHGACEVLYETFGTEVEYLEWRDYQQIESKTSFRKRTSKEEAGRVRKYEICHHEGHYEPVKVARVGHETKKLTKNRACLAFINTMSYEGCYEVVACFAHCGHVPTVGKLKLVPSQINQVIQYIKDGFTNKQITNKLTISKQLEPQNRLELLTNDDIRQIKIKHELFEGRLHTDDIKSLEMRIERNSIEDGILHYQPAQNSTGEGFQLVIMTPNQLQLLKRYSYQGVSIDDTHNTTKYSLKLTVLMIINGNGRGYPVGYMLSHSVTSADTGKFFECLRDCYPEFDPKYFISDDASAFFNGFRAVFPNSRASKILCRWHVFQNWKKFAKDNLKEPSLSMVLSELNVCLKTPSLQSLNDSILIILHHLENEGKHGCSKMAQYLRSHYFHRISEWSVCYRDGAPFQTTMINESFHARLKRDILDKNSNNRLDYMVCKLYEAFDVVVCSNAKLVARGLAAANPRKGANRSNCRKANLLLPTHGIKRLNETEVEISDENGATLCYIKDRKFCTCNISENSHCDCGACQYRWLCSCLGQQSGIACKHIHFMLLKGEGEAADGCDAEEVAAFEVVADDDCIIAQPPQPLPSRPAPPSLTRQPSNIDVKKSKYDYANGLFNTITSEMRKKSNMDDSDFELFDECIASLQIIADKIHNTEKIAPRPPNTDVTCRQSMHLAQKKRPRTSITQNTSKRLCDLINREDVAICVLCHMTDPPLPDDINPEEEEARITEWRQCNKCKTPAHFSCTLTQKNCLTCPGQERFVDYDV